MTSQQMLVVLWKWGPKSSHAGARFWAVHATEIDGRVADWPKQDLIALGAAKVTVTEGEGLDLLSVISERTVGRRDV